MNDILAEDHDPKATFSRANMMAQEGGSAPRNSAKLSHRAEQVAAQFAQNSVSPFAVAAWIRLIDVLMISAIGLAITFVYVVPIDGFRWNYAVTVVLLGLLTVTGLQAVDCYQVASLRTHMRQFGRFFMVWTAVFAMFTLSAFFMRMSLDFSRVWFGSMYLAGFGWFILSRLVVSNVIRRWTRDGRLERRAVIVGGGENAGDLISSLEAQPHNDIRICGIFDDRNSDRSPPMVAGYPKLGTISELVEFGRRARIDMLIVSLPITAESRVLAMLKQLWVLPVDIRLSAHTNKLRFRPRAYSYVGSVPFLDVFDKPIADWDSVMKRTFDIVFSIFGLIALSPVMLVTAIAIKANSKGPVIFRQKRFGFNNEVIDVLKFRSMYVDQADVAAKKVVTKNDPRVTSVGRFIRKSSIDELPQLVNVLRGELSLVGPRPHAVNAHTENKLWDEVVDGYFGRHKVKPGVTGWAQVNGWRGEVDNPEKIQKRVEHDLYYIENWSVLFDLYICIITPIKLLNTENAY